MMKKHKHISFFLLICILLTGCSQTKPMTQENTSLYAYENEDATHTDVTENDTMVYPSYEGEAYVIINENTPFFTDNDITSQVYEDYSPLDSLNRPGVATACLGIETMPPEDETRGEIGMIKPAGWHTVKYPDVISDLYLYNRCHLIGWQLSGENANELNLITGTRYLNVTGMLPFENEVADYIQRTNNHVLYRVTPVYTGNNLICDGLLMEARSVEDNNLSFCVYCYNVQPGITIDYKTGDSWLSDSIPKPATSETDNASENHYVLNKNSLKVHIPDCTSVDKISDNNKEDYYGNLEELIENGYAPCKQCNPK